MCTLFKQQRSRDVLYGFYGGNGPYSSTSLSKRSPCIPFEDDKLLLGLHHVCSFLTTKCCCKSQACLMSITGACDSLAHRVLQHPVAVILDLLPNACNLAWGSFFVRFAIQAFAAHRQPSTLFIRSNMQSLGCLKAVL
jgi:hypothetical protein